MNYEHKHIAITFREQNATFNAQVNSEWLRAPSLTAIKKKIDLALEQVFKPFSAISADSDTIKPFTVLRVECRTERRHKDEKQFVTDAPGWQQHRARVTLDTPKNRAQIAAYNKLHKDNHRKIELLKKEIDDARRDIPEISASEFGVTK